MRHLKKLSPPLLSSSLVSKRGAGATGGALLSCLGVEEVLGFRVFDLLGTHLVTCTFETDFVLEEVHFLLFEVVATFLCGAELGFEFWHLTFPLLHFAGEIFQGTLHVGTDVAVGVCVQRCCSRGNEVVDGFNGVPKHVRRRAALQHFVDELCCKLVAVVELLHLPHRVADQRLFVGVLSTVVHRVQGVRVHRTPRNPLIHHDTPITVVVCFVKELPNGVHRKVQTPLLEPPLQIAVVQKLLCVVVQLLEHYPHLLLGVQMRAFVQPVDALTHLVQAPDRGASIPRRSSCAVGRASCRGEGASGLRHGVPGLPHAGEVLWRVGVLQRRKGVEWSYRLRVGDVGLEDVKLRRGCKLLSAEEVLPLAVVVVEDLHALDLEGALLEVRGAHHACLILEHFFYLLRQVRCEKYEIFKTLNRKIKKA